VLESEVSGNVSARQSHVHRRGIRVSLMRRTALPHALGRVETRSNAPHIVLRVKEFELRIVLAFIVQVSIVLQRGINTGMYSG
jgi:hypothetical protein